MTADARETLALIDELLAAGFGREGRIALGEIKQDILWSQTVTESQRYRVVRLMEVWMRSYRHLRRGWNIS